MQKTQAALLPSIILSLIGLNSRRKGQGMLIQWVQGAWALIAMLKLFRKPQPLKEERRGEGRVRQNFHYINH